MDESEVDGVVFTTDMMKQMLEGVEREIARFEALSRQGALMPWEGDVVDRLHRSKRLLEQRLRKRGAL